MARRGRTRILRRDDIALSGDEAESLRGFLWFDLCAEYDATHLHSYIQRSPERYSDDFLAFENIWWRDEMIHFEGFRLLYSLLYGESPSDIQARLDERVPDFGPLESFFGDEFRLCLLFAYDELATTRAYHEDFAVYRRFGSDAVLRWIRHVTRDESFHYQNAVRLVRDRHAHRLTEIATHVADFVTHDLGDHAYRATFLFDHDGEGFSHEFCRENGRLLVERLGRPGDVDVLERRLRARSVA